MIIEKEIWKDIIDYEGLYQVSSYGRVKSLSRKVSNGKGFYIIKERILKSILTKKGYYNISLYKNGKSKNFRVHRLVALHFISNPENKPQINHIDGDKSNNHVDNLEWCTASENTQHAYDNGLKYISSKHIKNIILNNSKPVYCPELKQEFKSMLEASKKLNIQQSHISKCCNGKRKSTGKHPITNERLTWRFK